MEIMTMRMKGGRMCALRNGAPDPKIEQPVKIKACLRCNGDLAWQYNEWTCMQCGRVRKA